MWRCLRYRVRLKKKVDIPFCYLLGNILNISLALDALAALTVADTPQDVFVTPPQLDGDLVTLTLLPRSRWQTLLNLEVIQVRTMPPKCSFRCSQCWHAATQQTERTPKASGEGALLYPDAAGRRASVRSRAGREGEEDDGEADAETREGGCDVRERVPYQAQGRGRERQL